MLTRARPAGDDTGFTLVELLVTITILAVVGALMLTGLVQALRTNEDAQDRIDAFNRLQIATERMVRELRAADPLEPQRPTTALRPDDVEVQIRRGGDCVRWRYRLAAGQLVSEQAVAPGCGTYGTPRTQVILPDIARFVVTYQDARGTPVTVPRQAVRLDILIEQRLATGATHLLQTEVNLRNA